MLMRVCGTVQDKCAYIPMDDVVFHFLFLLFCRVRLNETSAQLHQKRAELSDRLQKFMPPLYKDVAFAVTAPVLLADYDNKIQRQQTHAALQEKVT